MSGERRYRRLGSSCRTIFAFFKDYYNEECPRLENYYRGTNRVIARFIIKNGQICATLDRAMVNYNLLQSIN